MDNQHKLINGYRDLSREEIDMINEGKKLEAEVLKFCHKVSDFNAALGKESDELFKYILNADAYTWAEEGHHDIQTAFMKIIRAIAKPQPGKPG